MPRLFSGESSQNVLGSHPPERPFATASRNSPPKPYITCFTDRVHKNKVTRGDHLWGSETYIPCIIGVRFRERLDLWDESTPRPSDNQSLKLKMPISQKSSANCGNGWWNWMDEMHHCCYNFDRISGTKSYFGDWIVRRMLIQIEFRARMDQKCTTERTNP